LSRSRRRKFTSDQRFAGLLLGIERKDVVISWLTGSQGFRRLEIVKYLLTSEAAKNTSKFNFTADYLILKIISLLS